MQEESSVVPDPHISADVLPQCATNAGPFDNSEEWMSRINEEFAALIHYVDENKANDTEWFTIDCNDEGTKWFGECWHVHNMNTYRFKLEINIPAAYPNAPVDIVLPDLDGKTPKMYRGGSICLDAHFAPLWQRNAPKYGIAHALALGLAPWLASEVPQLVARGVLEP